MKKALALIILSITLVQLSACSSSGESKSETTAQITAADTQTQTETEFVPELPELDYGGESFTFISRLESSGAWNVLDAYTGEENGEVLNDAIYARNRSVSEKLGVDITETQTDDTRGFVKKTVLADERLYDAVLTNGDDNFSLASNGYTLDMNTLKYTDFSKPWWDEAMNDALSLYGKQYYAISDMNVMAWEATWITMANKTVLENLGIDIGDIYDKVRDGVWTIDEYAKISALNFEDVNGNNTTDSADRYGTVIQSQGADGFIMGCGVRYITKNSDGDITLVPLDERTDDVFNKVSAIVNQNVCFNSHNSKQNDKYSENTEYSQQIFAENRAIFFTETLQCVRRLRDMDTDFGVIPMPKYDESQENYISMTHWWATSMLSVPLNAPDADKTSAVLEYMSYLSSDTVKPAYYDVAINGKYLRDEESVEMMDYIMQERVIDLSYILYGTEKISGDIRKLIYQGDVSYASAYEKLSASLNLDLEKKLELIRDGSSSEG